MLATRPGWLGPTEVVEVSFDPAATSFGKLLERAKTTGCVSPVFFVNDHQRKFLAGCPEISSRAASGKIRDVDDRKFYLGRTTLRHLPMTRVQATRINADVDRAADHLSPNQLRLWAVIREHPKAGWPNVVDRDFREAESEVRAIELRLAASSSGR